MTQTLDSQTPAVTVTPARGVPVALVVCEHASPHIPADLGDLGLPPQARSSHIAWDPGALGVAQALATHLDAVLVAGGISRLVYDCNRPPEAASAIPERSEQYEIPGNTGLDPAARADRVNRVYGPFRDRLDAEIRRHRASLDVMVTVHSFTPVYHGQPREVQLGILHGLDTRLAQAMMQTAPDSGHVIRLNEPYAARDGVAHTLDVQAVPNGLLNVMIEIRNDLIATPQAQAGMAALLAPWIGRALGQVNSSRGAS